MAARERSQGNVSSTAKSTEPIYLQDCVEPPTKVFANGLTRRIYTDVFGRKMFLPILDRYREKQTTMVFVGSPKASPPIDIRTRMLPPQDDVFEEGTVESRAMAGDL